MFHQVHVWWWAGTLQVKARRQEGRQVCLQLPQHVGEALSAFVEAETCSELTSDLESEQRRQSLGWHRAASTDSCRWQYLNNPDCILSQNLWLISSSRWNYWVNSVSCPFWSTFLARRGFVIFVLLHPSSCCIKAWPVLGFPVGGID